MGARETDCFDTKTSETRTATIQRSRDELTTNGRPPLCSAGHFARLRIDSHHFTFLDKKRHAHGQPRL